MADESLKTSQASLWIQPDGANTEVFFLGCHDLDDVSAPEGGTELVRRFNPDGTGWSVMATKKSPPDPITTTITTLLYKQRDWIEKVKNCPFNLYVLFRECGRADVFANNIRGLILAGARIAGRTYGQLVRREEDLESTVAAEIEAVPPLLQVVDLTAERIAVTTAADVNDIVADMSARCYGSCGAAQDPGDLAMYVIDALVGTAAFSVRTTDEGQTWTASAAAPYAAGVINGLQSGIRVQLDRNTYRLVVGRLFAAGAGSTSYSDDNGATWTAVALPNGTGPVLGGSIILVGKNLWMASAAGYIFKSVDYGETWTAMLAGSLGAGNLNHISFADDLNGMAVGAAGFVVKTVDGGLTWALMTAPPGAAALNCVDMLDAKRAWVGSAVNSNIFFTTDGGTTWTVRTGWPGAGIASALGVTDIDFLNDLEGIMVTNTNAPVGTILRTINGGLDWQTITTPTNVGLTCCAFAREDLAFVGGLLSVTSMVIKVRAV